MKNDFDFPPVAEYSKEKYDQWRERHGYQAFSGDWNEMLARKMCDPELDDDLRFLSWLTLYAAGNFSDWPVDPQGNEKFQKDCVKDTGMAKQRVSEAVARHAKCGYVLLPDSKGRFADGSFGPPGRMIQPDGRSGSVNCNVTGKRANKERTTTAGSGQTGEQVAKKSAFQNHRERWLTNHPEKAAARARAEMARAEAQRIIDAIDVEILSDWNRAQQGKKNGSAESERAGQKVRKGEDKKSGQGTENEPGILITSIPSNLDSRSVGPLEGDRARNRTGRPTPSPQSEREDLSPLVEAIPRCDETTARQISEACRAAVPELNLTVAEIARAANDRMATYGRGVRKPPQFLIEDLPAQVKLKTFRLKLERERAVVAREEREEAEREQEAIERHREFENYRAAAAEWAGISAADRAPWIAEAEPIVQTYPTWDRMPREAREREVEERALLLYARHREAEESGKLKVFRMGGA